MRIRIQGVNPMRIRILVRLCRHKNMDFDLIAIYRPVIYTAPHVFLNAFDEGNIQYEGKWE